MEKLFGLTIIVNFRENLKKYNFENLKMSVYTDNVRIYRHCPYRRTFLKFQNYVF